jgi:uncharacterized protein YbjT (DUF2867 family)
MILIVAAQGNQGRVLIPKLIRAQLPLRACVRTEASASVLREAGLCDVVVGDIAEQATIAKALRGVRKVYHVGPACHPLERQMGMSMIVAAREHGVEHFIYSSTLHAITTELVQHEIKRDVEERLVASGLEFTILQPANYMLPLKLRSAFQTGAFRMSWSLERKQCLVALDDLTDVALEVIANGAKHYGATYELAGPGRYTGHDIRDIIARVTGRAVVAEVISPDQYLRLVFGEFDDADFAHQLKVHRLITAHLSKHDFIGNSNVLEWLLGRKPATYEQFVRQQYEQFKLQRAAEPAGV